VTSKSYDCNFCAISRRQSPADVVDEDDLTIAFAAYAPVTEGHTLLIPQAHIVNLLELSDDLAAAIGFATKATAMVLSRRFQFTSLNVLHASGPDAQQSVFHFHHHLVPRWAQGRTRYVASRFRGLRPPCFRWAFPSVLRTGRFVQPPDSYVSKFWSSSWSAARRTSSESSFNGREELVKPITTWPFSSP
jgi:histidine triad (HIT) family protein